MGDGAMGLGTAHNRHCFESLFLKFIAVAFDKIKHKARNSATNELIKLLHQEKFNLSVFKGNGQKR